MENVTKTRLQAGQTVLGFRMDFAAPYIVEVLGKTGFDFVYFDCEHGPMTERECVEMIRAAELTGVTPLVRTPSTEPGVILRFLDSGAMGVIVPHCQDKETAQHVVKAVKYPPMGERGMGGRSLSLSGMPLADYIEGANKETLIIVMIEDLQAVKNLSGIVSVEGIDVLFVGRLDLSVSLGIPGQLDHPKINEIIKEVIYQARGAGKTVGVGAVDERNPERIQEFVKQGARFFSINTTSILTNGARQVLQRTRGSGLPHTG